MASAVSKLRDLTTKPATAEYQEEWDKQTGDKADDRSLCLLLTAQLENSLDRAIDFAMGEQSSKLRHDLYDRDGPLGNFSRKTPLHLPWGCSGQCLRKTFDLCATSATRSRTLRYL
jgi:hypothetical protein